MELKRTIDYESLSRQEQLIYQMLELDKGHPPKYVYYTVFNNKEIIHKKDDVYYFGKISSNKNNYYQLNLNSQPVVQLDSHNSNNVLFDRLYSRGNPTSNRTIQFIGLMFEF